MVVAITSRLACGLILVLTCSGCFVGRAMQDWVVHVEQVANQKELAAEERRLAKRDYLAARVDLYKDHRSQGQRSLSFFSGKDLQQEVIVPAAAAAFHGEAVTGGMLFEQRECEAIEPSEVLPHVFISDA